MFALSQLLNNEEVLVLQGSICFTVDTAQLRRLTKLCWSHDGAASSVGEDSGPICLQDLSLIRKREEALLLAGSLGLFFSVTHQGRMYLRVECEENRLGDKRAIV